MYTFMIKNIIYSYVYKIIIINLVMKKIKCDTERKKKKKFGQVTFPIDV